jgi:hypothetical protein
MVASYDHTVHRTIGIPPAEVTWANQTTVSKRLYGRKGPKQSCKFSPGDRVRLSKTKRTFQKGYLLCRSCLKIRLLKDSGYPSHLTKYWTFRPFFLFFKMVSILYTSFVLMTFRTYKSTQHLLEVSVLRMAPSDTDSVSAWFTCGKKTPRSEVVFLSQVVILYTVIIVSIYNIQIHYFRQFRRVMSRKVIHGTVTRQSQVKHVWTWSWG